MNKVEKKQNNTLNILKALCAVLIVFNHCVFPGEFGVIVKDISRIAVPFFFLISGYYVYQNRENKILKKFNRIFLMLISACLFWLIYTLIRYAIISPIDIKPYLKKFIDLKVIFKFFIFNNNHFWGHLWFLNALVYCYFIEFVKKKFKQERHYNIEVLISILLLISYVVLNYFVIDDKFDNIYLIRNFIFVGIPFFLIGKNLNNLDLKKISTKRLFVAILIAFSLLFIERILYVSELYVTSIIVSILLFVFCLKKTNISNSKLEFIGKYLNVYIYIFHPAIKYIIVDGIDLIGLSNNNIVMYIYPLVTLFTTIIFSYYVYKFNIWILNKKRSKKKSCLVMGYMNSNLGDDLFFQILFDRYPNVDFYIYPPSNLLDEYMKLFKHNKNVIFYDEDEEYLKLRKEIPDKRIPLNLFPMMCEKAKEVDFFINIGGSIFIQNESWKNDDRFIIKDIMKDKPSFIVGCNFGPGDDEYYRYYKKWFKKFDDICFRDRVSYDKFKDLKNARLADDIVLLNAKKYGKDKRSNKKTIGMSILDPSITKKLKGQEKEYYKFFISTIKYYVKHNYEIKLYSFCNNEGDINAINKIVEQLNSDELNEVEVVEYKNDIKKFMRSWRKCEFIIGTRFHSSVLAIACNQQFLPVIYSDKTSNYLMKLDKNISLYDLNKLNKIEKNKLKYSHINMNFNSNEQFSKIDDYVKRRKER